MRTPLLTLLLVGCTAQQVDTSSSNDAIENGSEPLLLESGIYDLPQSNKTIYIAAEGDKLVLDVDGRAPSCLARVVDVSSGEATAQTSESACEMNLRLVRTPDGIDVRGTVTGPSSGKTREAARYDGSYIQRQENVLDGRYKAGRTTLIVDESVDTQMAVSILSDDDPNATLSGRAYAIALDDVMKGAVAAALGWAPARGFSVSLPGDCDGSLYVQRDERGEFSIVTHAFEGSRCPSGVLASATRFRRER